MENNAFYLIFIDHSGAVPFFQTTLYRYFFSGGRIGYVGGKIRRVDTVA